MVECESSLVFLSNLAPFPIYTTLNDNIIDVQPTFEFKTYYHAYNNGMLVSKDGTFYRKIKEPGKVDNHESPYIAYNYIYDDKVHIVDDIIGRYADYQNHRRYLLGLILKDADGKRFVKFTDPDENYTVVDYTKPFEYKPISDANAINNSVDFNNIGDWELVYSYDIEFDNIQMVFMKNGVVKYLKVTRVSDSSNNYLSIETNDFPNSSIIDANTRFVTQDTEYTFISNGNTLYKYTFSSNTLEAYYTIPSGEAITALCFNAQQNELLVGSDSGKIYVINVVRDMNLTDNEKLLSTIEGFTKIIDIDYRFKDLSTAQYSGYESNSRYWD